MDEKQDDEWRQNAPLLAISAAQQNSLDMLVDKGLKVQRITFGGLRHGFRIGKPAEVAGNSRLDMAHPFSFSLTSESALICDAPIGSLFPARDNKIQGRRAEHEAQCCFHVGFAASDAAGDWYCAIHADASRRAHHNSFESVHVDVATQFGWVELKHGMQ
jgi:hypothetical protein